MTPANFAKQKRRVERYIKKWHTALGMRWWTINFDYSDEDKGDEVAAITHTRWAYRHAKITFYLPVIADIGDTELENGVIHEFCHVLVNEMRQDWTNDPDKAIDHEEHVVTGLATAFKWARLAGGKK